MCVSNVFDNNIIAILFLKPPVEVDWTKKNNFSNLTTRLQ